MKNKVDYSLYECPYSHLEKEIGHKLHGPEGYEDVYSVWCTCGFRSPVFYLDPEDLGLKLKKPSIEEAKKELIEILDSLEGYLDFKKYPNSLFWKKDGQVLIELDRKNNHLLVSCDNIWSIFELKYSLIHHEVRELIIGVVAEYWGIEGVTIKVSMICSKVKWQQIKK